MQSLAGCDSGQHASCSGVAGWRWQPLAALCRLCPGTQRTQPTSKGKHSVTKPARTITAAILGALGAWWLSHSSEPRPDRTLPIVSVALADEVSHPRPGAPGAWRLIGQTHAGQAADHDTIVVRGPSDNFRRLKFKVTDAPLNLHRLVITYDNGAPDRIEVRQSIREGGESGTIDLRGAGKRSIRKVDFWYDTQGLLRGKADVTLFGMK